MVTIPSAFSEAMRLLEAGWKVVTIKEMNSLIDLGVYTLVPKSKILPGRLSGQGGCSSEKRTAPSRHSSWPRSRT